MSSLDNKKDKVTTDTTEFELITPTKYDESDEHVINVQDLNRSSSTTTTNTTNEEDMMTIVNGVGKFYNIFFFILTCCDCPSIHPPNDPSINQSFI